MIPEAGSARNGCELSAQVFVDGRQYRDRAMIKLRSSVAGGFKTLEIDRSDPDLDPLGQREDFQVLLMDLAFPTEPFAVSGTRQRSPPPRSIAQFGAFSLPAAGFEEKTSAERSGMGKKRG